LPSLRRIGSGDSYSAAVSISRNSNPSSNDELAVFLAPKLDSNSLLVWLLQFWRYEAGDRTHQAQPDAVELVESGIKDLETRVKWSKNAENER